MHTAPSRSCTEARGDRAKGVSKRLDLPEGPNWGTGHWASEQASQAEEGQSGVGDHTKAKAWGWEGEGCAEEKVGQGRGGSDPRLRPQAETRRWCDLCHRVVLMKKARLSSGCIKPSRKRNKSTNGGLSGT
jgi:hypothetical protein